MHMLTMVSVNTMDRILQVMCSVQLVRIIALDHKARQHSCRGSTEVLRLGLFIRLNYTSISVD